MTQPQSPDAIRTFRVASPLKTLTPLLITCVVTLGVIYAVFDAEDRWILLLVGAVLAFSVALTAWLLTRTRLEVSSDGIAYYGIGYRVRSTWGNLRGYAKRTMGANTIECLILSQPGLELSGWAKVSYALMPVATVASLADGQVFIPSGLSRYEDAIPVGMFARDWRSGELGELIKQYAPQAFDNPVTS